MEGRLFLLLDIHGDNHLGCYCISDPIVTYAEQSTRLYDKMERDLQENGPMFLEQGETSQSLSLSDLFTLKDGVISPVLKVDCSIFTSNHYCNVYAARYS